MKRAFLVLCFLVMLLAGIIVSPLLQFETGASKNNVLREEINSSFLEQDQIRDRGQSLGNDFDESAKKREGSNAGSLSDDSSNRPEKNVDDLIEVSRRVTDAHSAEEARNALNDLYAFDPELAEQRLRFLDDFCNPSLIAFNLRAVKEKAERFCGDYLSGDDAGSMGSDISDLMDVNAGLRFQVYLSTKLSDHPRSERSDLFTQLVLGAGVPIEIDTLISITHKHWHQHSQAIWELGADLIANHYPEADLIQAQEVALLLYRCARFGGCGANQFYTAIYCLTRLTGRCDASSGMEELLYRTTSPVNFGLAQDILSDLYRLAPQS